MMFRNTLQKRLLSAPFVLGLPNAAILFLLGVLFGIFAIEYCAHYLSFHISDEVAIQLDPLNFASLVITIILTVYVMRRLGRSDDAERATRDLFIEQFVELDAELSKSIRGFVVPEGAALETVAAAIKRHRMRAQRLTAFAIEQDYLSAPCKEARSYAANIKKILDLLTETPKKDAVEDGVRITNGKLFYSTVREETIFKTLNELNMDALRLAALVRRTQ